MTKTSIAMLGIDLGKNTCSLAGLDASGAVVLRKKMTREAVVAFISELGPCIIAMEPCCGAHFMGRTFAQSGPHGEADVSGVRAALCEGAED